jgi:uncharacterized membrane protein
MGNGVVVAWSAARIAGRGTPEARSEAAVWQHRAKPAPPPLAAALHRTARVIEAAGVAVIVTGAPAAIAIFLLRLARRRVERELLDVPHQPGAGRSRLTSSCSWRPPSSAPWPRRQPLSDLSVLALIVLIRTFLSFSLEVEIKRRGPWQAARQPGEPPRGS